MQLWFVHGSEVTIREQLVTQFILGILSGDLAPGQRLPSTRDLARRFRLHPNTVSAGFRELERARKREATLSAALALDQLIANLFRSARTLGVPLPVLRSRVRQWLEMQPPDHFLLIEPDEELRKIVATEIEQAVTLPVRTCGLKDFYLREALEGAIPVALPSKVSAVRQALPAGTELLTLQVRSVPSSLAGWLPAPSDALVGIASRWPDFLKLARTMLIAAGFNPDTLVLRDAREPNWHRGLRQTAAVVCDSVTARELPKTPRVVLFSLLSEATLAELRDYQEFVRSPLVS